MEDREQLLNRAKERLKNLKKVDVQTSKIGYDSPPKERYARKSMGTTASAFPMSLAIREMNSPTNEDEGSKASGLNQSSAAIPTSPKKRGTRFLSTKEMTETRVKLKRLTSISHLLERNVSLATSNIYDELPIFVEPLQEPINTKRRKKIQERLNKPVQDGPIGKQDIEEIGEMAELYGSSSLVVTKKWECTLDNGHLYDYIFKFPVYLANHYPKVHWSENSPSDGFFVGDQPLISKENYDRLLSRLVLTEPSGNWFIGPRELEIAPDPLNYVHYHSIEKVSFTKNDNTIHPEINQDQIGIDMGDDVFQEIQVIRKKPLFAGELERIRQPSPYLMIVELSSIIFKKHSLFHQELSLCQQLSGYLESFEARKQSALVWSLQEKIWAMRVEISESYTKLQKLYQSNEQDDHTKEDVIRFQAKRRMTVLDSSMGNDLKKLESELIQLLKELSDLRQLRDAEAQTDLMLEFNIVKTWESIKQLRSTQGYQSTGYKLTIKVQPKSNPIDLDREMQDEIEEMDIQLYIENQKEERQYQMDLAEYSVEQSDLESQSLIDSHSAKKKRSKKLVPLQPVLQVLDYDAVEIEIKKRHKKSFGTSSKQQSLSFRWVNLMESITPNEKCPPV